MELSVLDLETEGHSWDAALRALPAELQDVYFTAGYQLLWQHNGDGAARGAVFRSSHGTVLFPFLLRRLSTAPALGPDWHDWYDIASAYGYGGPLVAPAAETSAVTTSHLRLIDSFRTAFAEWCRERRIVSELVRFHPLLENEIGFLPAPACCPSTAAHSVPRLDIAPANTTVWACLSTPEAHRAALSSSARRNLRKAVRAGLTLAVESSDDAWDDFIRLYDETMRRRSADDAYLFPRRYYEDCRRLLGDQTTLLAVRRPRADGAPGMMVAAAVFLRSRRWIHYHLGGSDVAALPERPNNLLFVGAMDWGAALGARGMHLGGGFRKGGDDELFRFKAGFSPLRARLHLGRCIHLLDEYDQAVDVWRQHGGRDPGGFFPTYRAPLPASTGT